MTAIATKMGGSRKAKNVPRPPKELSKKEQRTFRGRFAMHLQSLLTASGVSKDELANETGLGEPTIRKWLRADGTPDVSSLESIAAALGIDDYRMVLPPPKRS